MARQNIRPAQTREQQEKEMRDFMADLLSFPIPENHDVAKFFYSVVEFVKAQQSLNEAQERRIKALEMEVRPEA
jgi:hypothetical protein